MLNLELTSYGFDEILKEIRIDLESAIDRGVSKKRKDEIIYKTLGAVNALWNMIQVVEVKDIVKDESE